VGIIGATALLGYVLGIYALYSFPPYNSIALPTAVASIAVSAAALTYVGPSLPARGGDWRRFLAQFFAPLLIRVLRPQTADFRRRLGRPALALFRPPA